MKRVFLSSAMVLLLAAACSDPAAGKPKAGVTDAKPEPVKTETPTATAMTFTLSPETSSVGFVGSKVTGSHEGKFAAFTGTIEVSDKAAPEKSTINVELDMTNFTTDDEKLTGHLKSPDFFDVEKFPKATFTSTEIKAGGENGATHTITGNLDFHGVKKSITFPATVEIGDDAVSAKSEFVLKRQEFGISYAGAADNLIKDEVVIKLDLKATAKK